MGDRTRRPTLILFLKAPRFGAVKTRLAHEIGAYAAWRFHKETAGALISRLAMPAPWRCLLAVTPDRFTASRFWPERIARVAQGPGDLGERMARAFRAAGSGPAVLVGGDIPELDRHHIRAAFAALGRHDAVFGPSADGGYWLVGLRHTRDARALFRGVRWSGPYALNDTLENATRLSVLLLDELTDVDTGADHRAWRERRRDVLTRRPRSAFVSR